MGTHIGATWRIWLNEPRVAAMRPYFRLLSPLVFIFIPTCSMYHVYWVHTGCIVMAMIHTHNRLTALFPGLPGWAGTRKVKPIWILLKQETVSGSGISWAICKLAPCSRETTTPAPHHSVFYRPDALPAAQPTVSKHWRKLKALKETKRKQIMQ